MQSHRIIDRVRNGLVLLVKLTSVISLAGYLTLTILYVAPMNPLKPYVQSTLMRTVGHYMAQNWSLFAPNPASQNLVLEVAYLTRDQRHEYARGGVKSVDDDAWLDLTTPLITEFHRNRLSGTDRFSRPADSAMRQVISGGADLSPWSKACQHGDAVSCLVVNEQAARYRQAGVTSLRAVGSAACTDFYGDCTRMSHIVIRIRTEQPVPWSRRNSADARETSTQVIGLFPYLDGIVAPRLYASLDRNQDR